MAILLQRRLRLRLRDCSAVVEDGSPLKLPARARLCLGVTILRASMAQLAQRIFMILSEMCVEPKKALWHFWCLASFAALCGLRDENESRRS